MFSFKTIGQVEIRNGIRININGDICAYYRKLFTYYTYSTKKSQLPMYGAHVSVILPLHGVKDFRPAQDFDGQETVVWYDPEDFFISTKNVWMKTYSPVSEIIKEKLGVVDGENFLGLHLVVCNFKHDKV